MCLELTSEYHQRHGGTDMGETQVSRRRFVVGRPGVGARHPVQLLPAEHINGGPVRRPWPPADAGEAGPAGGGLGDRSAALEAGRLMPGGQELRHSFRGPPCPKQESVLRSTTCAKAPLSRAGPSEKGYSRGARWRGRSRICQLASSRIWSWTHSVSPSLFSSVRATISCVGPGDGTLESDSDVPLGAHA